MEKDCHFTELLSPCDCILMYMKTAIVKTLKNSIHWKCRQADRLYFVYSIYIKGLLHFMTLQVKNGASLCNILAAPAVLSDMLGWFMSHS